MPPKSKAALVGKALFAQYSLLAYNLAEAALSLFFGNAANSIALVSFGLDSLIESASTLIVTHRLRASGKVSVQEEERRERRAFMLVGWSFILLSAYVAIESIRKLFLHEIPAPSLPGMVIAAASILVMPLLSKYRHGIGHEIGSHALVADSKQTMLCAYMSAALLAGMGANFLFGFWWADPLAGLIIAALAFLEGRKALRGETCC
ncbi:Cation efflux family protein [uncultured archaeon]|nr:Cation efflux family protein [uncultured archaeon]